MTTPADDARAVLQNQNDALALSAHAIGARYPDLPGLQSCQTVEQLAKVRTWIKRTLRQHLDTIEAPGDSQELRAAKELAAMVAARPSDFLRHW
jgi:hypothetical protein